jgi:hypothetical protein
MTASLPLKTNYKLMKKKLLVIFFVLLSGMAYSQNNGNYNYSIGVRGYNYMQMPDVLNQTNNDTYLSSYFTSYIIKFNDNLFSYRLNGSYLKNDYKFYNNCGNCELADGEMKDFSFKVGFEKSFNYSVIQPYVAFDLGYRSNKFEGVIASMNQEGGMDPGPVTNIHATKEGFTITPVIGIKINPIKQLTLFAESNLEFFYSYERQERVIDGVPSSLTLNKYNKSEYLINPVALGIQFHLDAKN